MTRLAKVLSLSVAVILASAAFAGAEALRRTPAYRPYITEVGPPRVLDRDRFATAVYFNSDLKSWVKDYGYPDVAEIQDIVPEYGWNETEIRIYYFDRNQELAFGRVSFFPFQRDASFLDNYGLIKYEGPIQPENLKRVATAQRLRTCDDGGTSLNRLLAAAERAEKAALLAEKESARAAQAAQRAESTVGRMETGFTQSLRK